MQYQEFLNKQENQTTYWDFEGFCHVKQGITVFVCSIITYIRLTKVILYQT